MEDPAIYCVTHHRACDCREAKIKQLRDAARHIFIMVDNMEYADRCLYKLDGPLVALEEAIDAVEKIYGGS